MTDDIYGDAYEAFIDEIYKNGGGEPSAVRAAVDCATKSLRAELAAAEAIASFGEDDRIQTYFQKWKRENDKTLRLRADLDAYQKERDEEVARLRAELAAERNVSKRLAHLEETLSGQLAASHAERDELHDLLREARDIMEEADIYFPLSIDAALKASPSDR